jgi:hypothetical protein
MSRGHFAAGGPDITDVMLIVEEIKRLHGADVHIELTPTPGKYSCAVIVRMRVTHPSFVGPGRTWEANVIRTYPTVDHRTFEGMLYSMALWCDRKCSADLWKQGELESFS